MHLNAWKNIKRSSSQNKGKSSHKLTSGNEWFLTSTERLHSAIHTLTECYGVLTVPTGGWDLKNSGKHVLGPYLGNIPSYEVSPCFGISSFLTCAKAIQTHPVYISCHSRKQKETFFPVFRGVGLSAYLLSWFFKIFVYSFHEFSRHPDWEHSSRPPLSADLH
jgi:putative methionine-R-sulfoxide reductase with GAF domain